MGGAILRGPVCRAHFVTLQNKRRKRKLRKNGCAVRQIDKKQNSARYGSIQVCDYMCSPSLCADSLVLEHVLNLTFRYSILFKQHTKELALDLFS
jgi:hypothetical protein